MKESPVTLSVIIPIFNEEEVIPELNNRLLAMFETIGETWEVVFVNDGSTDKSAELLDELSARDTRYRVLHFSRNFGHQLAITAGADYADGQAVVIIDADLQDPPEVIVEMLEKWREGYDVVYGVRAQRAGETLFKRLTAAAFYRTMRAMVGIDIPLDTGDFRLMSHRVVLALRGLRESHRFIRGMVVWVGFKHTAVYYNRLERFAGVTKYPLRKMLRFAIDGITSFSTVPLRISSYLAAALGCAVLVLAAWSLWVRFIAGSAVPGWTSTLLVVTLVAAPQFLMIGILGEYVGRIYEEVKNRPLYLIRDKRNIRSSSRTREPIRREPEEDDTAAP